MDMVSPTDTTETAEQEYQKLQTISGQAFDREFLQFVVNAHRKAIDEFSEVARTTDDPRVRQLAQSELPTLEKHLGMAEAAASAPSRKLGANPPPKDG